MNRLLLTIVSFCVLQPLMAMEIVPSQQKGLTIYQKHMQLQEKRSNDTIQTKLDTELSNANKQGLEFHQKLISEQKNSNFDALQAELDTKLVSAIKQGSVFYEQLMVQQGNPTNDALRKKLNIQLISCSKVLIINKPVLQINAEHDALINPFDDLNERFKLFQAKYKPNYKKAPLHPPVKIEHPTPQNTTWFNHGYTWCINNPKKTIAITLGTGIVAYYAYNLWSNSPSSHSTAPRNVVQQTKEAISSVNEKAKETISTVVEQTKEAISSVNEKTKKTISAVVEQTKEAISSVSEKAKEPLSAAISSSTMSAREAQKISEKVSKWMLKKLDEGKSTSWVSQKGAERLNRLSHR